MRLDPEMRLSGIAIRTHKFKRKRGRLISRHFSDDSARDGPQAHSHHAMPSRKNEIFIPIRASKIRHSVWGAGPEAAPDWRLVEIVPPEGGIALGDRFSHAVDPSLVDGGGPCHPEFHGAHKSNPVIHRRRRYPPLDKQRGVARRLRRALHREAISLS